MKLNEKKIVLLGLTLSIPILLYSAPITIPVTFADGNVLTAAQLNQNFTAILNKINELDAAITSLTDRVNGSGNLLYPDGINGEAVTEIVTDSSGYTVPVGKTLYITSYKRSLRTTLEGTSINITPKHNTFRTNPIIIKSDITIYAETGNDGFTGFLVSSSFSPIIQIIRSPGGYTVPMGKTLIITSYSTEKLIIDIGGQSVNVTDSTGLNPVYNDNSTPLIIKSGCKVITSSNNLVFITGYLK